jgi:hypothetical protein
MNNSVSENVRNLVSQIEEAKEEWVYKCMNILHYGLPFDKAQLKEYFVNLVKESNYKIFTILNSSGFNNKYLGYSYDYKEGVELKYIAEFTITKEELSATELWSQEEIVNHKEINSSFKIEYTLPLLDGEGNILKKTITF